jgi:hypothetical protein
MAGITIREAIIFKCLKLFGTQYLYSNPTNSIFQTALQLIKIVQRFF